MYEDLAPIVGSISQAVESYKEVHSLAMKLVEDITELEEKASDLVAQCHHLDPEEIAPVSDSVGRDITAIIRQIDTLVPRLKGVLDEKDPYTVTNTLRSISLEIDDLKAKITQIENRLKRPLLEILSNKYSSLFGLDKSYVFKYLMTLSHEDLVGIRDAFTDLEAALSFKYPVGDPYTVLQKVFGKVSTDKVSDYPLEALPSAAVSTLNSVRTIVLGYSRESQQYRFEMLLALLSMLPVNAFLDKTQLQQGIYSVTKKLNKLEEALTALSKYSRLNVNDTYSLLVAWVMKNPEDVSGWGDLSRLLASFIKNTERVSNLFHMAQYLSRLVQACEETMVAVQTRDLRTLCEELNNDLQVALERTAEVDIDMTNPDPMKVVELIATGKINETGLEKISTYSPASVAKKVMEKYIRKMENYLSDIKHSLKSVASEQHLREFLEEVDTIQSEIDLAKSDPMNLPRPIRQLDELLQRTGDYILQTLAAGGINEIDVSLLPVDNLGSLIKVLEANGKKVVLKVIDQSDGNGL